MKETHKITVTVDGRNFICHMKDTAFLRIYERRVYQPGKPWECIGQVSRWHFGHNAIPKRGIIRSVMDAATAINKPL